MKTAISYLLSALMLITATACADNSAENTNGANASEASGYTELFRAEPDSRYADAVSLIDEYMSGYLQMNFEENEVTEESSEVLGHSTEGGALTEFKDENGNIIRYRLNLYGETGNFEGNYYVIGDSRGYYTALKSEYDSWRQVTAQGVLRYDFEEYWIDGGEIYRMDNINKRLTPCVENPIAEPISEAIKE